MQKRVMNAEDDRGLQRVKIAMDSRTAKRLHNFADRAGLNLSEAGLHFIELGMERQVAMIAAQRHAATLHRMTEAELAAMGETDEEADKEAWEC